MLHMAPSISIAISRCDFVWVRVQWRTIDYRSFFSQCFAIDCARSRQELGSSKRSIQAVHGCLELNSVVRSFFEAQEERDCFGLPLLTSLVNFCFELGITFQCDYKEDEPVSAPVG